MAEKMEMNKQLEAPLRPVAPVEDDAVLVVSLWGLLNAASFAIVSAILSVICPHICNQLLPIELTDKEAAKANASILRYYSWCSVPQAAAGTLALLLAGRRRRTRRALAYVVLAATVAGHCMLAGTCIIYLPAGIGYFFTITTYASICVCAKVDLGCFLALME